MTTSIPKPAKVFVSYAHEDADARDALHQALAQLRNDGLVAVWTDRQIAPGADWSATLAAEVEAADLFLMLVSSAFLASTYCTGVEATRALARAGDNRGWPRVIPVVIAACDWETSPLAALQALPAGAVPVEQWERPADAWLSVAKGVRGELTPPVVPIVWTGGVRTPRWWLPAGIGAAALGLAGLLLWLGHSTHGVRLDLLSVAITQQRSVPDLILTGMGTLVGPVLRVLTLVLTPDVPVLIAGVIFAGVLGLTGVAVRGRLIGWATAGLGVVWGAAVLPLSAAVAHRHHLRHLAEDPELPEGALGYIPRETGLWLTNGGLNVARADAVAGLVGLVLLATVTLVIALVRARRWWSLLVPAVVGIWLLWALPRADAFSRWGIRYPEVTHVGPCFEEPVRAAVADRSCTAWDVSAGGTPLLLILDGPDCEQRGTFTGMRTDDCTNTHADRTPVGSRG